MLITRAKPVIRTQPQIPNMLRELVMMQMMPANAPMAMTAFTAGSVANSIKISTGGAQADGGGLKIRSVLLIY